MFMGGSLGCVLQWNVFSEEGFQDLGGPVKGVSPGSSRTGHLIFSLNIYHRQEPGKGSVRRQSLGSKVFSADAKNKEKTVAWRNGSAIEPP